MTKNDFFELRVIFYKLAAKIKENADCDCAQLLPFENNSWSLEVENYEQALSTFKDFFNDIIAVNDEYLEKEKAWYLSMTEDIDMVRTRIWDQVSDTRGHINSNYGRLVFGRSNFCQFDHVLLELKRNSASRRAQMIYTRPSMQVEATMNEADDFICTNTQHFFIEGDKLHCILNMRSNDIIYGLRNDFPWFLYVWEELRKQLLVEYPKLKLGIYTHQANSIHVYKRHYKKILEYCV